MQAVAGWLRIWRGAFWGLPVPALRITRCIFMKFRCAGRPGGQGVGRRLLRQVIDAARQMGGRELTLTTFAEVPWNAPFYARIGFEVVDEGLLDARLRGILAKELAHGLTGRCAMRLYVGP